MKGGGGGGELSWLHSEISLLVATEFYTLDLEAIWQDQTRYKSLVDEDDMAHTVVECSLLLDFQYVWTVKEKPTEVDLPFDRDQL